MVPYSPRGPDAFRGFGVIIEGPPLGSVIERRVLDDQEALFTDLFDGANDPSATVGTPSFR